MLNLKIAQIKSKEKTKKSILYRKILKKSVT